MANNYGLSFVHRSIGGKMKSEIFFFELVSSYLLPIRWQGHTVVSDHTVSNLSPTTPNHTCNYNINILVGLGQHFIQQRWSGNPKLARTIHFI